MANGIGISHFIDCWPRYRLRGVFRGSSPDWGNGWTSSTIQTATTLQMSAVGTYNDGSQKKLTNNVHWSSASPNVATINGTGLVTGVGPGQSAIECAAETVTGSATVTGIIGNLTSINVTSQDGFTSITLWQQRTVCGHRHCQRTTDRPYALSHLEHQSSIASERQHRS